MRIGLTGASAFGDNTYGEQRRNKCQKKVNLTMN